MKDIFKNTIYTLLLAVVTGMFGCTDDLFEDPNRPGKYPEGTATLRMSLDFEPFAVNDMSTRAPLGDQLDRLDDLCLIAYDLQGNLMEGFPVEITDFNEKQLVDRDESDASNGKKGEEKTWHAEFTAKVPYGRYYMYAVANLGHYDGNSYVTKTIDELKTGKYSSKIAKRTDFLAAEIDWDASNGLNNGAMLGFFTDGKQKSPQTGQQTNDKTVDVNRPNITLHSWLRRCASKVTIDFDGSKLSDKVTIYVKRATIHDIPESCAIGYPNAADETSPKIITYKDEDYRPDNLGAQIEYASGADHKTWPAITNKTPFIMEGGSRKQFHNYNSPSLFLYENMQGDHDTPKNNKEQDAGPDGTVVGASDMKDNVKYGSYIEVEAYYERIRANNDKSEGKLIYRFMLGKDIYKNFDVERNYHYKLTLCPRGYGNDVDWHIEYLEENRFEYKDPYYVSYLYNHDSTIRFRYTPEDGKSVTSLEAEIVGNNWWPDDPRTTYETGTAGDQNQLTEGERNDPLNGSFSRHRFTDAQGIERNKYLGNGFLSLRATNETVITREMTSDFKGQAWETDGFSNHEAGKFMNDNYFYGFKPERNGNSDWKHVKDPNLIDRSRCTYSVNGGSLSADPRERYECSKQPDGSYIFNIPMFTRAKNMVKESGYTGNNPYEGSSRSAYVRLKIHLSDGNYDTQIIRVEQVPRITNPKGIYRKSGNNENFKVILSERDGDEGPDFLPLRSDGRWMAEIIGDANFINLNGRSAIQGNNDIVSFTVRFNKMNRDKKVRNAVIRIRYHNYSCVHLIFVRQGYSSQSLDGGATEWHTMNMVYDGVDADDPRDEGSLFKFGDVTHPIDAHCNVYPGIVAGMYPPQSVFGGRQSFDIATSDIYNYSAGLLAWDKIPWSAGGYDASSGVATMEELAKLYNTKNIEQAYGVLYADGATETQMKVEDAFGYSRYDEDNAKRGMCGVFVYYWDKKYQSQYNARNIFLPIGRAGYGHRKENDDSNSGSLWGTLRYACASRNGYFPSSLWAWEPLFYDLSTRKGAIYYAQSVTDIKDINGDILEGGIGLDLNYFSFDFNAITKSNVKDGADACFLRRVGKQTLPKD